MLYIDTSVHRFNIHAPALLKCRSRRLLDLQPKRTIPPRIPQQHTSRIPVSSYFRTSLLSHDTFKQVCSRSRCRSIESSSNCNRFHQESGQFLEKASAHLHHVHDGTPAGAVLWPAPGVQVKYQHTSKSTGRCRWCGLWIPCH